jgi:hydrogenase nickel incorporation protein HypB
MEASNRDLAGAIEHLGPGAAGHVHDHAQLDHDHPHSHDQTGQRLIRLEKDILEQNRLMASRNTGYFAAKKILALNLMSAPGSGKTTLLEATIRSLNGESPVAVIEGDQQTLNDARRIEATGAPVVQVNTGNGCHLDAGMIMQALEKLDPAERSVLFIENVGNLVCPSLFDLGEHSRVVIVSVTEGEDKPLKYPTMFERADLVIFNKTDLLPYLDTDLKQSISFARQVNPGIACLELSAKTGEGLKAWLNWIRERHSGGY